MTRLAILWILVQLHVNITALLTRKIICVQYIVEESLQHSETRRVLPHRRRSLWKRVLEGRERGEIVAVSLKELVTSSVEVPLVPCIAAS